MRRHILTADPYQHLPTLRGQLTPPEQSELRVTPQVLAAWDERARRRGQPDTWRLSDDELERARRAFLEGLDLTEDLWVYAYGSLMWNPGFHFAEVRRAEVQGYQRRFTYKTTMGRGSPLRPGLMLALEPNGGSCQGLAFRIGAGLADPESAVLWRREMIRGSYHPCLLPVGTPQGEVRALAFTSKVGHPSLVGELPLAQTVSWIASGVGELGTNRDYLAQLAGQLEHLGIEDAYIAQLHERVCAVVGA